MFYTVYHSKKPHRFFLLSPMFSLGFLCLFFLCGLARPVHAQNLLDLLTGGKSGDGKSVKLQSPEEIEIESIQARQKEVQQRHQDIRKQRAVRQEAIVRELRELRADAEQNRQARDQAIVRMDMEEGVLRAQMTRLYEEQHALLRTLESAYSSRSQSLVNLRDTLRSQLMARKKLKNWLLKQFGPNDVPKLQQLLLKMELRITKTTEALKQSTQQLIKLNQALEESQAVLNQSRQQLLAPTTEASPPPTSRPTSTSKPTHAPDVPGLILSPTKPRDPLAERQHQAFLQSLAAQHKRVQFDVARIRVRLHQIRQEDERFNQEYHKHRLQLFSLLRKDAREHLQSIASQTEGGLWFRKKLHLKRTLLKDLDKHNQYIRKQTPVVWASFRKELSRGYQETRQGLGLWMEFLLFLGLLLIVSLTFWLRRQVRSVLKPLSMRIETTSNTRTLWQTLWLGLKIIYDHIPLLIAYAALWLIISLVDAPEQWENLVIGLALIWVLFRTTLTFINLLFHRDTAERLVKQLDEDTNTSFRRTLKVVSALLFGLWASTNVLHTLQYPADFLSFVDVIFSGFVVLCIQLVLWNKDAVLSIIPRETRIGRLVLLWTYRLYRYLSLLILVLFGIYLWGYRALAVFLAQGLIYTTLVSGVVYGFYRLTWQAVLWVFGFSKGDKALIELEKRTARNVTRFLRVFLATVLSLSALLFLLEIWGITGAIQAFFQVINYPLVRVQDTHVTPISLGKMVIAVVASVWLSNTLKRRFADVVYPLLNLSPSSQYAANTVVGYSIIIVGALGGLQWMGVGLGGLAVFAGIISIGVGFGLQNIANNFISGLLIIFGRPIAVKDIIEVGGLIGEVKDISTRSVTIETLDGRLVLIPNAEILTSKVINWSLGPAYVWVKAEVGVAYGSDTRLVNKLLMEIAQRHPKVLQTPIPAVRFNNFGSSSLDFALWVAIADPITRFVVLSELRYEIDDVFRQHNVVIAFPQQDIHLKTDLEEALLQSFKNQASVALQGPPPIKPAGTSSPTREMEAFSLPSSPNITSPKAPSHPPEPAPSSKSTIGEESHDRDPSGSGR